MDVTPIVEVLEAMPSGPTVNVNVEVNPTLDGDLTLLRTGDLNAPFGRDFMDIEFTHDQSTHDDHSQTTNIGGGDSEKEEKKSSGLGSPSFGSPSFGSPSFGSPSLPTFPKA